MTATNWWSCALATRLCVVLLGTQTQVQAQEVMTRQQVIAQGEKMALAQFDHMNWNFWGRYWMDGVFFAGVSDLAKVSDDPKLFEAIRKMGARQSQNKEEKLGEWSLLHHDEKVPNHADDMCLAQAFLYYYERTKDPKVIADTKARLDQATSAILSDEAAHNAARAGQLRTHEGLTWSWCDALFMAAPVHAHLSVITGDPKYLEAMHLEWKRTSDLLYDAEEHLYFRDKRFIDKKTRGGKKVFWSRGNGWVMGAFARTLPHVPENDPLRDHYITQFRQMSARLASLQRPDGTWSPSLLDYEQLPYSELSGTALNCFAMAWGINHGILDETKYRPVVEKAWAALLTARRDNGFLGHVQGVGDHPAGVSAGQYTWYGNGIFLMAAAQVAEMAPIQIPELPALSAQPQTRRQ